MSTVVQTIDFEAPTTLSANYRWRATPDPRGLRLGYLLDVEFPTMLDAAQWSRELGLDRYVEVQTAARSISLDGPVTVTVIVEDEPCEEGLTDWAVAPKRERTPRKRR